MIARLLIVMLGAVLFIQIAPAYAKKISKTCKAVQLLDESTLCRPVSAKNRLKACKKKVSRIEIGMTRGEVLELAAADPDVVRQYKAERFILKKHNESNAETRNYWRHQLCMTNIDFRPAKINDEEFNDPAKFEAWKHKAGNQPSNDDVVTYVYDAFIDSRFDTRTLK